METDCGSKTNEIEAQGLDLHLCIICQRKKNENLVEKPEAHEKVWVSIEEWSKYGNLQYTEVWNKLRFTSVQELEDGRASWHRSCYKDAVHAGMLRRARERYERQLEGPNESRRKSRPGSSVEIPQLTCSQTFPYNKNNLHNISTFSAGESLRTAIGMSGNDKLSVKLNTSISPDDAHSIDIKYHKNCWAIHVSHVLRRETSELSSEKLAGEIAAQIEFLTMTEMTLRSGKVATMSELQDAFERILESNNVENPRGGRKALKQLLLREIPEIEFHAPKRVNESERVSIKRTRDEAIQMTEDQTANIDSDMKTLFDAAAIIRKSITKSELFSFYRWIIQGSKHELSAGKKSEEVYNLEAQIEASVLKRMELNDGLYIPPDLVLGRHVFFAVDNVDFAEDTPDGKNTFHGTAMAIYQRQEPGDVAPELTVVPGDQCRRSIRQLPESVTTLLECPVPPGKPAGPTFPQFGLGTENQLPLYIKKQDFTWLLGRSLTRTITNGEVEDDQPPSTDIPVWSGYNSTMSSSILGGNHVKRGEAAHMVTLQALFSLYQEAFFLRHPSVRTIVEKSANQLSDACKKGDKQDIKARHEELAKTITSTELAAKMEQFDADHEDSPLFKFTRGYMAMVMEMMMFIRAVRTGDWDLHLEALQLFVKYFFAHDMLNYARMIPEFQNGNWVVNKNEKVAFGGRGRRQRA
ncbi:unnamed protein product [Porites lobata]|uniref:Uncharacterized protein n=1 Tax=Porites lobata TaxID=104759 RepID=A0ABN8N5S4_9CNID|nr:unnamed protein product [Porites lobata]